MVLVFLASQSALSETISDCSSCSRVMLTEEQLSGKTLEELALLRNEILARKGYVFSTPKYSEHFKSQSWYEPAKSNDKVKLSEIESKNVKLLQKREAIEKKKRDNSLKDLRVLKVLKDLRTLKAALNSKNEAVISKYLSKEGHAYTREYSLDLKEVLNKINLNNVDLDKGYYSALDDGFCTQEYSMQLGYAKGSIRISHKTSPRPEKPRPKKRRGFDDEDFEYIVCEMQYWCEFDVTENGIVIDECNGAG